MPIQRIPQKQPKKKGGGFWGSKVSRRFVSDLGDIAGGVPAMVVQNAKDLNAARRGDIRPLVRTQTRAAKASVEDLRHPLRHPGYSFVTALGLASPFAKGAGGALSVGRGARAAARAGARNFADDLNAVNRGRAGLPQKPRLSKREAYKSSRQADKAKAKQTHRTLSYTPKTVKEAERMHDAAIGMPKWKKDANIMQLKAGKEAKFPVTVQKELSRQPVSRAVQRASDRVRGTGARQRRKVERKLAYDKDVLGRLVADDAPDFTAAVKSVTGKKTAGQHLDALRLGKTAYPNPRELVREANALVRALRLYRVGYVPPNWLGAQATNLIQMGPAKYFKGVRGQHRLRKNENATARALDRTQGETAGQALMDVGRGIDKKTGLEQVTGPTSAFTRGVGTSIGKATDRAARNRSLIHEYERQGVKLDQIPGVIERAIKGDPKAQQIVVNATEVGEKASIKFSRSRPLRGVDESVVSHADRILAENIFLYKWITGSTQYTGRMLKERPLLSAVAAQEGRQGPQISDVLDEFPEFMSRYVPIGEKKGMPTFSNLQAASLYDMPGDIVKKLELALTVDPTYAGEQLNPFQHAFLTALTKHNLFNDRRLPDDQSGLMDRINFALDAELGSIPYLKLLPNSLSSEGRINDPAQQRRLFPLSNWDVVLQHLIGGGYPTRANPEVARRMARQQKPGRTKKRKKRSGL